METIELFRDVLKNPDAVALEWKSKGGKVVGFRCINIPEEIIWAAGMLPYPLYGTPKPITLADSYFQPCSCEFIRNLFDHALDGRFKFLDYLVLSNMCDIMRRLPDMWEEYIRTVPVYMINNPQKLMTGDNREYYLEELNRFKARMEEVSGTVITDRKLTEAIGLYNEARSLLKEIYTLREQDPPPLSGQEAFEIAMATTVLPKDRAVSLLKQLLAEIGERDVEESSGVRILVTGSIVEHTALISMIEQEGAVVVADDLCTTTRNFWYQVEGQGNPMEALYRYMNRRPLCACLHPSETRFEYLMELIRMFKVDGVININLKYCHPFLYEAPMLRKDLEERDIPMTTLEVGHDLSGHGQLRTRIQAFIEMIDF